MPNSLNKQAVILVVISTVLLLATIVIVVTEMRGADEFPWGIHLVTIPVVFLGGIVAGWVMRERQASEEKARAEISGDTSE